MFVCSLTHSPPMVHHLVSSFVLTHIKEVSLQEEMSQSGLNPKLNYHLPQIMKIYEIYIIKNHIGPLPGSALFYTCGGTSVVFFLKPMVRVMMR